MERIEPGIQRVQRAEKQNGAAKPIADEEVMNDAGRNAFLTRVCIGE